MYPQKLKETYQYPGMSNADLDAIIAVHQQVFFKKGDFLLQEGQVSDCYYILEEGIIRSFIYDFDGNDISADFFCVDELVIEVASIFNQIPTQENFQCLSDCILWKIDFPTFQQLFHSIPAITEWGRAWLAYQLFLTKKRTIDMIRLSAKDRYKQLIDQKPLVLQQAPLKQIASFLGITDSSLSRIRKDLFR